MRTEATCAMWIDVLPPANPLRRIERHRRRRHLHLRRKQAVPPAPAAGTEHVADGERPALPHDDGDTQENDQQYGAAGDRGVDPWPLSY